MSPKRPSQCRKKRENRGFLPLRPSERTQGRPLGRGLTAANGELSTPFATEPDYYHKQKRQNQR